MNSVAVSLSSLAAQKASGQVTNISRAVRQRAQEQYVHIQLRDLPRTALPSDIRRVLARERIENVSNVAIDYHRFLPTGRAYLALTHPDFMRSSINSLQKVSISNIPITIRPSPPPEGPPRRTRGAKGRAEAVDRGLVTGNGPDGGIRSNEKCVVLWGLPGKLSVESLKAYLHEFKLAGPEGGSKQVAKIDKHDKAFSLYSRHLVRLSSTSEAHRLVRRLHMTYFEPDAWGKKYQIRARVVY